MVSTTRPGSWLTEWVWWCQEVFTCSFETHPSDPVPASQETGHSSIQYVELMLTGCGWRPLPLIVVSAVVPWYPGAGQSLIITITGTCWSHAPITTSQSQVNTICNNQQHWQQHRYKLNTILVVNTVKSLHLHHLHHLDHFQLVTDWV